MKARFFVVGVVLVVSTLSLTGAARQDTRGSPTGEHEERLRDLETALAQAKADHAAFKGLAEKELTPVGAIVAFSGPQESVPEGWMLCNGDALRRADFKELYAVVKECYQKSEGDKQRADDKSFNLPDFRGMFLRGLDGGRGLDRLQRFDVGTATPDEKPRALGTEQLDSTRLPRFQDFKSDSKRVDVRSNEDCRFAFLGGDNTTPQNNYPNNWSPVNQLNPPADRIGIRNGRPINVPSIDHLVKFGGDGESRPVNIAVNYIIRVK